VCFPLSRAYPPVERLPARRQTAADKSDAMARSRRRQMHSLCRDPASSRLSMHSCLLVSMACVRSSAVSMSMRCVPHDRGMAFGALSRGTPKAMAWGDVVTAQGRSSRMARERQYKGRRIHVNHDLAALVRSQRRDQGHSSEPCSCRFAPTTMASSQSLNRSSEARAIPICAIAANGKS
jgi:hypothetical protein